MADQERDDLDPNAPDADEDAVGLEDDDFDADDEGDEDDLEDEDQFDADERLTGEVGSEGGSPGETVTTRRRGEQVTGSEAGQTWNPEQDETRSVERVGEENAPRKRNP
jgi:hypothetical protein